MPKYLDLLIGRSIIRGKPPEIDEEDCPGIYSTIVQSMYQLSQKNKYIDMVNIYFLVRENTNSEIAHNAAIVIASAADLAATEREMHEECSAECWTKR